MSKSHNSLIRQSASTMTDLSSCSTFTLKEHDSDEDNDAGTVGNVDGASSREGSLNPPETSDTLYFEPRKVYRLGNNSSSRSSLVRVYSENERANFDHITGTRMFDDLRHRPIPSASKMGTAKGNDTTADFGAPSERDRSRRYSMNESAKPSKKRSIIDMQDEYIPEFDFADVINKWEMEDDDVSHMTTRTRNNLSRIHAKTENTSPSKFLTDILRYDDWNTYDENNSGSASPNSSYVLDSSHAQVEPIPLPNTSSGMVLGRGMNEDRDQSSGDETGNLDDDKYAAINLMNPFQRIKSSRRKTSATGSFNSASSSLTQLPDNTISVISELKMTPEEVTELIEKLPSDFLFMPYSSRKKFILDTMPNKDYKLIMPLIKKFMLKSSKSSSSIAKGSIPGPPVGARSRHGSVASQYLSSFSPAYVSSVASMGSLRPDDKGMEILGHRLGKVIGFGAWGMIRECYDMQTGATRAIKIVRFRNNVKVKNQVLKEVKIWEELKNEHILRLIKWRLDEDYAVYCLSEKIRDGTLYDLVISWGEYNNSKIALVDRCKTTIQLCLQVVSAIKYMHAKSIVHGDVKLENCLLDKNSRETDWRVLVCDFGMGCHYGHCERSDEGALKFSKMENLTPSEECVQFISPIDGKKIISCRRRPSIPMSRSSSNVRNVAGSSKCLSESQKVAKNRSLAHAFTPLGVSSLPRTYGPSLTSARIANSSTPSLQHLEIPSFSFSKLSPTMDMTSPHKSGDKNSKNIGPDPNSHIGSLPYAAPELLEPSPPPLGPSADIWALGVMIYAMLTGKLPFKHDYEPRLRAIIAAGRYDKEALASVCGLSTKAERPKFQGMFDAVVGCLTVDINERWDLAAIESCLRDDLSAG